MADKKLQKDFEDHIKKCKKDNVEGVNRVLGYLREKDLDEKYQSDIISAIMKGKKMDSVQYALRNKLFKLFLALFGKMDHKVYVSKHNLLYIALESKSDKEKCLEAVLRAYHQNSLPIDLRTLPDQSKQRLYDGSWSSEIIKCLYNQTDSFFIPRGQKKAKMHALVYYNTFERRTPLHTTRAEAKEEAENMVLGLREGGFTVFEPLVDWTYEELLVHLREKIRQHKYECSVLVICIMSHGGNGIIYDKNSIKGEINGILKITEELPNHLPVVMLIQSCQGGKEPNQAVSVRLRDMDGETDATIVPGSGTGHHDSQIVVERPNTVVVVATPPGFYASRHVFFYHMGKQFREADGETTFGSMVTRCSRMMSQHEDVLYSAQAPLVTSLMRLDLILPRALQYDRKIATQGKLSEVMTLGHTVLTFVKDAVFGGRRN